ncbi:twin-arginine translocase TatA/TatE family subunit [Schumannella soli]|uniref:Sec-independent protein translocase protein TatA n=1 Tax=Schumannella soli TaxID=2590779 RepID=A0A506Y465_9MICO|nr:twin-arginine translocase TatA/TatE family subunit [Schumannella soli]TPW76217.1 twin-arginine translocase TatA/TatE family subunit [Schumannella soli]
MGFLGNAFTGWHLLLVLAVIVLIFGATKLPALARSVGQSAKILKSELKDDDKGKDAPAATVENTAAPVETSSATTTSAPPVDKP